MTLWINTPAEGHSAIIWGRENDASHNRFHLYMYGDGTSGTLGFDYYDFDNVRHGIFGQENSNAAAIVANK